MISAAPSTARHRISGLGAPWDSGDGERALASVLAHAELVTQIADRGAELTAARTRRLPHGQQAADDPYFQRALREASARAAVASAAAEHLLRSARDGSADVEDVESLEIGLQELARTSVRRLFDTLGASSTQEQYGLHLLWDRLHELETRSDAPFVAHSGNGRNADQV